MPLGVAYIYSALKEQNYDVEFYDMDYQLQEVMSNVSVFNVDEELFKKNASNLDHALYHEFKEIIRLASCSDILFAVHSSNVWPIVKNLISFCREILPAIRVIVGGYYPSVFPRNILEESSADVVVLFEGEDTIITLFRSKRYTEISGIAYRNEQGIIVINQKSTTRINLNQLPFPSRYISEKKHPSYYGTIIATRGCPGSCNFCASPAFWGGRICSRSADSIITEMQYISKKYGTRVFRFVDENFTSNKSLVRQLCFGIKRARLQLSWSCLSRVDFIDNELLDLMQAAGCYAIYVGVESGSDFVLGIMNKGVTRDLIIKQFKKIQRSQILAGAYIMVGFPGEQETDRRLTLSLLDLIRPDFIDLFIATPYPGSVMYERMMGGREVNLLSLNMYFYAEEQASLPQINLHLFQTELHKMQRRAYYQSIVKRVKNYKYLFNIICENWLYPLRILNYFITVIRKQFRYRWFQ